MLWKGKTLFSTFICQSQLSRKSQRQGHLGGSLWNGAKLHESHRDLIRISHALLVHLRADKYTGCKLLRFEANNGKELTIRIDQAEPVKVWAGEGKFDSLHGCCT